MVISNMELIRIFTAGSVDDGKSTLIGRLLLDSNSLSTDVIRQVTEQGGGKPNLAFLTDGLRAERTMGITIDVAYSFFRSDLRQFILVDTPGHEEYTRNMFAGASFCDIAIVLLDAQRGLAPQSKKHIDILVSLGTPNVIFAINKMDLVDYLEPAFSKHCEDIKNYLSGVSASFNTWYVPISALEGANVVFPGNSMNWYDGKTIFSLLHFISPKNENNPTLVMEIEGVRKRSVYAKILSGQLNPKSTLFRYHEKLKIPTFCRLGSAATFAEEGTSISFPLPQKTVVERGQLWSSQTLVSATQFRVSICWMSSDEPGPKLPLMLTRGTAFYPVCLSIPQGISLNMLTEVSIEFLLPIDISNELLDIKKDRFILVDPRSNLTVGAGSFLTINNENNNS